LKRFSLRGDCRVTNEEAIDRHRLAVDAAIPSAAAHSVISVVL
jgi:hypothetical protein